MKKFRVGDIANGVETSEQIIEAENELEALRKIVAAADMYCEEVFDDGCQSCRKLGETTCGNDTKNLSCYEEK